MVEDKLDYEKLGLKLGLEIHQQLDTNKLFCNCPSILRQREPDYVTNRKLHVVAGESGEIDIAAAYQASLDKEFIYQGYDTTCLVELDESPPREVNKEALKIALQISLLLNAKVLPISQIMRKTVINGSNTSGFQRTVLIARDGYLETERGMINIEGIFLEEDSARVIGKENGKTIYRLDRLGIPLIEISTSPNIKTPEQAKEVALHIGQILRNLKVKRGIGTIRQDVNLSIKKGKRIELKGMQDMKIFVKAIENEVKREIELLKKGEKIESEVRNVLPDATTEFLRPMPGAARMYPETDLPFLRISRNLINEAKKELPRLRSEVEKELKSRGLNHEMIKLLFKQKKLEEFRELLIILNNPQLIAKLLLIYPKEIASREKISREKIAKILNKDILTFIAESLKKGKIKDTQIKKILERIVKGENLKDSIVFEKEDMNVIEEKIIDLIRTKPGLSANAYMGLIMQEFKGRISGKEAIEIIQKFMK